MNEKTAEDKLVKVSHYLVQLDRGEGPVNKGILRVWQELSMQKFDNKNVLVWMYFLEGRVSLHGFCRYR